MQSGSTIVLGTIGREFESHPGDQKMTVQNINDFISWLNNFKTRTATQNGYANPRVEGSNPSATPNIGDA